MAREERDIYHLDRDELPVDVTEDQLEDEEFDEYLLYHNFYGY